MFGNTVVGVVLGQAKSSAEGTKSILQIILDTGGVVAVALIVLVLMSIVSWYVIGSKWFFLRKIQKESRKFLREFWNSTRLEEIQEAAQAHEEATLSFVFRSGYEELLRLREAARQVEDAEPETLEGIDNIERSLRRSISDQMSRLEAQVSVLATVGSTAPFIGLFGTVWGIMTAFVSIDAQGAAGIDVVAQPIAEALIVTAAGLFAAIPAVIFNNVFVSKIDKMGTNMDNFANDLLNVFERNFFN